MTRAPHWRHQRTCGRIFQNLILGQSLVVWEKLASLLAFCRSDNVMPDVVWASNERLAVLLDEAGHLTGAPELAVEVLSPECRK